MRWELWGFWRDEGLDRKTGVRGQGTGNREEQATARAKARAKARFFDGDGIAQAEAWAYLRNKGKSKDKSNSRFPSGMTNKGNDEQNGKYGIRFAARISANYEGPDFNSHTGG